MTDPTSVTGLQLKAARALLGWSQAALAQRSGVGNSTIADVERELRTPQKSTMACLVRTLEDHGVIFVEDGVRLVQEREK